MTRQEVESRIARALVTRALSLGYLVSVYDGEEYALKRSTDKTAIFAAMFSTESDTLVFRNADGAKLGSVWLIYGNGHDLVSDHSDNAVMSELLAPIFDLSDSLCDKWGQS